MHSLKLHTLKPLLAPTGITLIAASFFFLALKIPSPQPKPITPPSHFAHLITHSNSPKSKAVEQQLTLLDSEPLFLPTRLNAAASYHNKIPTAHHTHETLFKPYPPTTTLSPETTPAPTALSLENANAEQLTSNPFRTLGEDSPTSTPNAYPETQLHLINLLSHHPHLLKRPINLPIRPELAHPTKLLLIITEEGQIGHLLWIKHSGSDSTDSAIVETLQSPNFLSQIPPGYYQISIGS